VSEPVNILVVDDLHAQRVTIEAALQEIGEHIVMVSSGREALKYLLDHDAAVVLLDVNMPEMDGFETASLIRRRHRTAQTPIIFLTADTDEILTARGYALGAVDYIVRPFPPEVLRAKIQVFASLYRAQQRIRRDADHRIELSREQVARAAAEQQSRRLRVLAEATGLLVKSLEGVVVWEDLLRLFVPLLAERAGLVLTEDGRELETWVGGSPLAGTSAGATVGIDTPGLSEAIMRVLHETKAEWAIRGEDGRVNARVLPLLARGEIYGVLVLVRGPLQPDLPVEDLVLLRDVVNRTAIALDNHRLYGQLRERDRRKDEFLAMLSHELRNPLGAIIMAARILETRDIAEDKFSNARSVIERQSLHLTRIVDDLLDVSRLIAGRIVVNRDPLNLREIVDRAVEALRVSGRLRLHELEIVGDGDGVVVIGDHARMEQVVTNLLVNSIKYTDVGGSIRVEVGIESDEAVVRVVDTGTGIVPELLPHVFDVFVQGRQTIDRAEGGLGIGLMLVRKLVELQGGFVEAYSAGSGTGSAFTIRMPRYRGAAAATAVVQPASTPPLRVLLVEDNDDALEMLSALLRHAGHEVHGCSNGPDAVSLASRVKPQLALVDIGLPGFDGLEVARRLRAQNGPPPVLVALTGYGQSEDIAQSREAGFVAHLVKPVSPDRLGAVFELAYRHQLQGTAASGRPVV